MRDSPAPSAAASSVTALYRAPPSGRADLFLPGTAGDFSLSASLSACTLLYEVPSRTGAQDSQRASEPGGGQACLPAGRRAPGSARLAPPGPARCAPGDPLPPPDRLAPGPAAGVAGTAAPATRGRSWVEVASVSSCGLEEAAPGRWLGTCGDPRGSLGSGPPMSAFPLQRWAIRIGPGSCAHEPLVSRRWRRGSGEGRPPGRWLAERSSEHSEGLLPSVRSPALEVTRCPPTLQGAVEPMQIDVDPQEDPQNTPDVNYVVENPTLVRACGAPWGGREACRSCGGPGQAPHSGRVFL